MKLKKRLFTISAGICLSLALTAVHFPARLQETYRLAAQWQPVAVRSL